MDKMNALKLEKISPQKYVELMNQVIQSYDGYEIGMSVYLVPNNDHPSGYSFDKRWIEKGIQLLLSRASSDLAQRYEVDVHLSLPN